MFALKEWENNLSPMIGKPVKILDIGIYKGNVMEEFAKVFLKSNKDAKYYGIDMWKQSEENQEINFDIIEKEANKRKAELNIKSQITFIKEDYNKALSNLSLESNSFNIIHINTNYINVDILYILILSFNLLKYDGIMIIDDYLLNKSNKVAPKILIDTLLNINKDHINILYIGYQVFIQKVELKMTKMTKIETNVINYLINKLNEYWIATDIKEYSLFFKLKEKMPDINPIYIDFNDIKIRHLNKDTFSLMKDINFLYKYKSIKYINDEIKDKSIYLKLNKLNLLVSFNDYSLLYLINDIKIGLNHKNNSNIYIVLWGDDKNNEALERYQTRYNLFFNFQGIIHTISLLDYYDNIETLDQVINRIKYNNVMVEYIDARNTVGKRSLNRTNLEKMYNIILVQILLLKDILKIEGSFKILIEENFIYVNDFLLLLNTIFEKVYIYTYSSKIGRLSLRIIATGFIGISDDLYSKIYKALINAKDKEIISLFNVPNTYINYESIENNIFQMTKNIIKIFDKHLDIIEKNINEVNKTIARRTLDDIYTYLINKL